MKTTEAVVTGVTGNYPQFLLPFAILGIVVSASFAWVRYPENAPYIRFLTAGLSLTLGLYSYWIGFDFPVANAAVGEAVAGFLSVAVYALVPAAILGVLRPSFALVPAAFVLMQKELAGTLAGGPVGMSHSVVMIDLVFFVVIALIGFELFARLATRGDARSDAAEALTLGRPTRETFALFVMCVALGAHLGNYFLSGYGKIMLDGGLTSWLFENRTQYLMLNGYNLGAVPLSIFDPLFGFAYRALENSFVLVNALTLFAQVFCFVAFFRKRWMIWTIVFFDVMHVTIFLLTGAFFAHWIILNSLLVFCVSRMPSDLAPRAALVAGAATAILGHSFFHTVKLAWYDSRLVRSDRVIAVYDDGVEARVPPSFFRESSYLFYRRAFPVTDATAEDTERRLQMEQVDWQVESGAWGQTQFHETMSAGNLCEFATGSGEPVVDFDAASLRDFVLARHRWAEAREAAGIPLSYHLFPHDHFSMPWLFADFEERRLDGLVAYRYDVETVCLGWVDGGLERQVLTRSSMLPLSPSPDRAIVRLGEE